MIIYIYIYVYKPLSGLPRQGHLRRKPPSSPCSTDLGKAPDQGLEGMRLELSARMYSNIYHTIHCTYILHYILYYILYYIRNSILCYILETVLHCMLYNLLYTVYYILYAIYYAIPRNEAQKPHELPLSARTAREVVGLWPWSPFWCLGM